LKYIQKQVDPQTINDILASPSPVLHLAAEAGNLEFSATLIEFYPESVNQKNESNQNFLHIAAKHHQLGMFTLVEKFRGSCSVLIDSKDDDKNNILHFAAMLPPPNGLDAMLQMKPEQKWLKNFQVINLCRSHHFHRCHYLLLVDIYNIINA
jgi:ankyrin repeat protein